MIGLSHIDEAGRARMVAMEACLAPFDMLEAVDRPMEIGATRVVAKAGGRSEARSG